jgi:hypothetical protein
LISFLDSFDAIYNPQDQNLHIKISSNNNLESNPPSSMQLDHTKLTVPDSSKGESILQEPMLTNRSNAGDITDRSQLLKEMRDKRKGTRN